jgi:hypothetical protein
LRAGRLRTALGCRAHALPDLGHGLGGIHRVRPGDSGARLESRRCRKPRLDRAAVQRLDGNGEGEAE